MNDVTAYETFCLWHGLHLHFTTNYDWIKYNGKVNVTKDSFMNRKEKYIFYQLSRKYNMEELKGFFISNLVENPNIWAGNLKGDDPVNIYKKWNRTQQRLTYEFEQDIIRILEQADNPDELVTVPSGGYPALLQGAMQNSISIETLVILDDIMNFFPMWNKKISDDIIWPTYQRKCLRYKPFIQYDKEKFKTILKESIKELCQ